MIAPAPAPYPRFDLPAWPIKATPARTLRPGDMEDDVAALKSLGFELLFDNEFVSLSSQLHVRHENARRRARGLRGIVDPLLGATQSWSQVFRHPAGMLVHVERYKHEGSLGWMYNEMSLSGREALGYGMGALLAPGARTMDDTAQVVRMHKEQKNLRACWEVLRETARAGCLIPFAEWSELPWGKAFLTQQARAYALPRIHAAATPSDISRIERRMLARAASSLGRQRLDDIQRLPVAPAEKTAWRRMVGSAVEQLLQSCEGLVDAPVKRPAWVAKLAPADGPDPRLQRTMPARRAQHRRESAAWMVQEELDSAGMTPRDPLLPAERATIKLWLDAIMQRTHPRHEQALLRQADQASLPRLGVEFHQALFACASLHGVPRKMHWWQAQQAPDRLAALCTTPASDGATLPMRWCDAWLYTANARVLSRQFAHRHATCARGLEELSAAVPVSQWCLLSDRRSMWDSALGAAFNAGVDEDLVVAHKRGLASILAWTTRHAFPSATRLFVPGVAQSVSLADQAELLEGLMQADERALLGASHARLPMLLPLVAAIQRRVLDQVASEPSAPRSRARL